MVGIIGSGFGLYGYLPALVKCNENQIFLLKRYKEKFQNRPELLCYENNITWVEDENTLLSSVKTIILSLCPAAQVSLVHKCLSYDNIKHLCLEKPLAVSANSSDTLLKLLIESKKIFRIGYTFQYTDWSIKLFEILASKKSISKIKIEWSFMANHYQNNLNNWKRFDNEGGSVIKFYGIHLIALSALLGYNSVVSSKSCGLSANELFKWAAVFKNNSMPLLDVLIDSKSDNNFFSIKIYSENNLHDNLIFQMDKNDPFVNEYCSYSKSIDPRVNYLTQVIESIADNDNLSHYNFYSNCNKLWQKVEECNINKCI